MLCHKLADGAGHGQTQVGVDVDLADGQLGSLTQLLLGMRRSQKFPVDRLILVSL